MNAPDKQKSVCFHPINKDGGSAWCVHWREHCTATSLYRTKRLSHWRRHPAGHPLTSTELKTICFFPIKGTFRKLGKELIGLTTKDWSKQINVTSYFTAYRVSRVCRCNINNWIHSILNTACILYWETMSNWNDSAFSSRYDNRILNLLQFY